MRNLLFSLLLLSPLANAFDPLSEANCQADYYALFSAPEINVTAVFGYDDFKDSVQSLDEMDHLLKELTAPCTRWDKKMCGFKTVGTAPHVLTRNILGPDGIPRLLRITMDQPAMTNTDSLNKKDPHQLEKSAAVKKLFLDGLANSQLTIYMGHSRDGGGPDFSPPRKKKNGHVDYSWYHAHKDNKKDMLVALQADPDKARIVALLSCSSLRFFAKSISGKAAATGVIGTNALYSTQYFEQLTPFFEKIFSYQCLAGMSVDDDDKTAKVKTGKLWKVPEQDQKITRQQSIDSTLTMLSIELNSRDISIRKNAYQEIKSFDSRLYSPRVWQALKDYEFGNKIKKTL